MNNNIFNWTFFSIGIISGILGFTFLENKRKVRDDCKMSVMKELKNKDIKALKKELNVKPDKSVRTVHYIAYLNKRCK